MQTSPRVTSNASVNDRWAAWATPGLALLLLAFSAWLGSCLLSTDRQNVADDAYITFTYARNLVEGHGLRFNESDPLVTAGCSTELHLLYSAAAVALGIDPLLATRALSLAAVLGLGILLGLAAARWVGAAWDTGLLVGAMAAWCLLLLPETRVHLASGMETLLFTLVHGFVLVWAAGACVRPEAPGRGRIAVGSLLLCALVLSRPEGWMLALLYAAALVVARAPRSGLASSLRECRGLLLMAAGVVVAYFAWRWMTFGSLRANPYYVKSANAIFGNDGTWLPGFSDTLRFALLRLVPAMILVCLIGYALALESRVWLPICALLVPSLCILLLYTRVIHEMAGGFRYEYPLLLPWLAAAIAGVVVLSLRSKAAFRAGLICAVFVFPALAAPVRPALWDYAQHARSAAQPWLSGRSLDNALVRAGRDLGESSLQSRASVLLSAAGQIPWYSRFTSIDWIGLNDTKLSGREALSIAEVWEYIAQRNPDVVQSVLPPAARLDSSREEDQNFSSKNVQTTLDGRGSALFQHWNQEKFRSMAWAEMRWLRENCVFGACYKLGDAWGEEWWVFLYVRKDSPHRQELLERLRASHRADQRSDLSQVFAFDPRLLTN